MFMDSTYWNNVPAGFSPDRFFHNFNVPLNLTLFPGVTAEDAVNFLNGTFHDATLTVDTTNKRYAVEFYQGDTKLGETMYSTPNPPNYEQMKQTSELFGEIRLRHFKVTAGSETAGADANLSIESIDYLGE